MALTAYQQIKRIVDSIVGLRCWHITAGGIGSTFSLALGAQVKRSTPLLNPSIPAEYREFEGEANLLVWCDWRVDGKDSPFASSDQAKDVVRDALQVLVGRHIKAVELLEPAWDLTVFFSGDATVRVFCDHIPGDPSFHGNWQLVSCGTEVAVGPGYQWEIIPEH